MTSSKELIEIMINLPAGMKDIDAIVERFMEAEDANFSLFNYVNEVNAEVEKLEEQIAEIKVSPLIVDVTCGSMQHRECSGSEI